MKLRLAIVSRATLFISFNIAPGAIHCKQNLLRFGTAQILMPIEILVAERFHNAKNNRKRKIVNALSYRVSHNSRAEKVIRDDARKRGIEKTDGSHTSEREEKEFCHKRRITESARLSTHNQLFEALKCHANGPQRDFQVFHALTVKSARDANLRAL